MKPPDRGLPWPNPAPIYIGGPTAIGKTATAIALALQLGGEIVSADSVQVYRGLNIGSAKPDDAERSGVPFHLIDVADPEHQYTVADWKCAAEQAIQEIAARGRTPIICGGTGLYFRALRQNWSFAGGGADAQIRRELDAELTADGAAAIHAKLAEVDPEAASRLHPNDTVRTIRALEVYRATGMTLSDSHSRDRAAADIRPMKAYVLWLPNEEVYARIGSRVDKMVSEGLEEEVRTLLDRGLDATLHSMRSLGYREFAELVLGRADRPTTVEILKRNTRRFAKRQMTWFRSEPDICWVRADQDPIAAIA